MLIIDILFWHWWVLAVALLTLEMLVPGFFFMWMAAAAFVTGSVLLAVPIMAPDMQLFIFSVLSVASILVWRRYCKKNLTETDRPHLNKRGSQYIGQAFTLHDEIVNNQGKLMIDGITWRLKGPNTPPGKKVRIIAVVGTQLQVEVIDD